MKTILVTSPSPGEGKTSTIANLGVVLAQADQRVAVVSGDLRRPRLGQFFERSESPGFTSVILGQCTLDDALQTVEGVHNLFFLGSGDVPPNPTELLASEAAKEIFSSLRKSFDVVLLDSPPVLPVTDADDPGSGDRCHTPGDSRGGNQTTSGRRSRRDSRSSDDHAGGCDFERGGSRRWLRVSRQLWQLQQLRTFNSRHCIQREWKGRGQTGPEGGRSARGRVIEAEHRVSTPSELSQATGETALERWISEYRLVILTVLDASIWVVMLVLATLLRFEFDTKSSLTGGLLATVAIAVAAQLGIGFTTVLYRSRWKVASFEEMAALALTVAATTDVVLIVNITLLHHAVPTSAVLAAGAFAFIGCAGSRGAWRLWREFRLEPVSRAQRVIVFGAGAGGRLVIDALSADREVPFRPVGLLDDDPRKRHLRLRHLSVGGGREALGTLAKRVKAKMVIIAVPSATSDLIREISRLAAECDLDVRVLPPVEELLTVTTVTVSDIRPITEVDLLGRHQVDTDVESIAGYISGRRVLVTGAGGSIGSELCRQIARFEPQQLVMLDHDETGLHGVQLAVEGRALLADRSLVVCDIRDQAALEAVFAEHRPEVVFHAAALKHLPLLEMWPAEAVKTNVTGTRNVLNAAEDFGSIKFVNISTDKAADPCSVLGYSKRVAERVTAATGVKARGTYLSVRFGNVLGSRGSVLTTFRAADQGRGTHHGHASRCHPILHDCRGSRATGDSSRGSRSRW